MRVTAQTDELFEKVQRLADLLKERLFQDSYTIEGPESTVWNTDREGFDLG